ncbi:hypothetical protein K3495_g10536 [Podosphaera aphanis]|nr:hypothetical protein K3495_g10536 [Podosphaera aphanis]
MTPSSSRLASQLGICIGIRRASKEFLDEVVRDFRRNLKLFHPRLVNIPDPYLPPIFYRAIKQDYKGAILEELPRLVQHHDKFDVELFPRYALSRHGGTGFFLGLEYRNSTLEKMKLSLSHWGGTCASAQYNLQPIDDRLGTFTFFPIQRIETEDCEVAEHALRLLTNALEKTRNHNLTVESLLLSQYEADNNGDPLKFTIDEFFPLRNDNPQEKLALLRSMAWDETTLGMITGISQWGQDLAEIKNWERSMDESLDKPIRQVHIRRVPVSVRDTTPERLRQNLRETVYHPGLLRRVRSRKQYFEQLSYREVYPNLMEPRIENKAQNNKLFKPNPNPIFAMFDSYWDSALDTEQDSEWDSERGSDWDLNQISDQDSPLDIKIGPILSPQTFRPDILRYSRSTQRVQRVKINALQSSRLTSSLPNYIIPKPEHDPINKASKTRINNIKLTNSDFPPATNENNRRIRWRKRAFARILETRKIDRGGLVRHVFAGPLIRYKYHVFDLLKL